MKKWRTIVGGAVFASVVLVASAAPAAADGQGRGPSACSEGVPPGQEVKPFATDGGLSSEFNPHANPFRTGPGSAISDACNPNVAPPT